MALSSNLCPDGILAPGGSTGHLDRDGPWTPPRCQVMTPTPGFLQPLVAVWDSDFSADSNCGRIMDPDMDLGSSWVWNSNIMYLYFYWDQKDCKMHTWLVVSLTPYWSVNIIFLHTEKYSGRKIVLKSTGSECKFWLWDFGQAAQTLSLKFFISKSE